MCIILQIKEVNWWLCFITGKREVQPRSTQVAEGDARPAPASGWREHDKAKTTDGARLEGLGNRTVAGEVGSAGQWDCFPQQRWQW